MYFCFSSTPKNLQEGRWKEVTETNNSNIATTEPIHSVNAIHKLEIDENPQMKRQQNVKCTDAERIKRNWTEERKFNKNYDDYKDQFFNMLSEFKDMQDGLFGRICAVKHQIELT